VSRSAEDLTYFQDIKVSPPNFSSSLRYLAGFPGHNRLLSLEILSKMHSFTSSGGGGVELEGEEVEGGREGSEGGAGTWGVGRAGGGWWGKDVEERLLGRDRRGGGFHHKKEEKKKKQVSSNVPNRRVGEGGGGEFNSPAAERASQSIYNVGPVKIIWRRSVMSVDLNLEE